MEDKNNETHSISQEKKDRKVFEIRDNAKRTLFSKEDELWLINKALDEILKDCQKNKEEVKKKLLAIHLRPTPITENFRTFIRNLKLGVKEHDLNEELNELGEEELNLNKKLNKIQNILEVEPSLIDPDSFDLFYDKYLEIKANVQYQIDNKLTRRQAPLIMNDIEKRGGHVADKAGLINYSHSERGVTISEMQGARTEQEDIVLYAPVSLEQHDATSSVNRFFSNLEQRFQKIGLQDLLDRGEKLYMFDQEKQIYILSKENEKLVVTTEKGVQLTAEALVGKNFTIRSSGSTYVAALYDEKNNFMYCRNNGDARGVKMWFDPIKKSFHLERITVDHNAYLDKGCYKGNYLEDIMFRPDNANDTYHNEEASTGRGIGDIIGNCYITTKPYHIANHGSDTGTFNISWHSGHGKFNKSDPFSFRTDETKNGMQLFGCIFGCDGLFEESNEIVLEHFLNDIFQKLNEKERENFNPAQVLLEIAHYKGTGDNVSVISKQFKQYKNGKLEKIVTGKSGEFMITLDGHGGRVCAQVASDICVDELSKGKEVKLEQQKGVFRSDEPKQISIAGFKEDKSIELDLEKTMAEKNKYNFTGLFDSTKMNGLISRGQCIENDVELQKVCDKIREDNDKSNKKIFYNSVKQLFQKPEVAGLAQWFIEGKKLTDDQSKMRYNENTKRMYNKIIDLFPPIIKARDRTYKYNQKEYTLYILQSLSHLRAEFPKDGPVHKLMNEMIEYYLKGDYLTNASTITGDIKDNKLTVSDIFNALSSANKEQETNILKTGFSGAVKKLEGITSKPDRLIQMYKDIVKTEEVNKTISDTVEFKDFKNKVEGKCKKLGINLEEELKNNGKSSKTEMENNNNNNNSKAETSKPKSPGILSSLMNISRPEQDDKTKEPTKKVEKASIFNGISNKMNL